MTPDQRASLAQQIASNPLTDEILTGIEAAAIERLVYASTETDRVAAQAAVRAARAFRQDLELALSTPAGTGAPL